MATPVYGRCWLTESFLPKLLDPGSLRRWAKQHPDMSDCCSRGPVPPRSSQSPDEQPVSGTHGTDTAPARLSPLSDRSYFAIPLRYYFQRERGNASHASTSSLGACSLGLALDLVVPHISVTRLNATSARGTILGPYFAFQVLSNGPDRSRLLSNGTRGTFAITHVSD